VLFTAQLEQSQCTLICVCFWTCKFELALFFSGTWLEDEGGLVSCLQDAKCLNVIFDMCLSDRLRFFSPP